MLHLDNISIKIGAKQLLNGVIASVYPGDLILVRGQNGAGKSTLFQALAGMHALEGRLILDGIDISSHPPHQRALWIGRLHQDPFLSCVASLTVEQNLRLAATKGRKPGWRQRSLLRCETWLESLLARRMNDLSGGQRQLVAFTMALQIKPRLLLLDEPTAALDDAATQQLLASIIAAQQQGIAILMITHNPALFALGTQTWWIEERRLKVEKNRPTL